MKRLITILILTVSMAGAINLTYPNDLVLEYREASEAFLTLYENACQDSCWIFGIWTETPTVVRSALLTLASAKKAETIAAWTALNNYITSE
jgi:hypothetical protein